MVSMQRPGDVSQVKYFDLDVSILLFTLSSSRFATPNRQHFSTTSNKCECVFCSVGFPEFVEELPSLLHQLILAQLALLHGLVALAVLGRRGSNHAPEISCAGMNNCVMNRVRICNLGCRLFPSKVVSDTPFLSSLWTDLSEIWYTFDLNLGQKSTKFFAKSVHRQLR